MNSRFGFLGEGDPRGVGAMDRNLAQTLGYKVLYGADSSAGLLPLLSFPGLLTDPRPGCYNVPIAKKAMVPASHVLKFLHLANKLGLDPRIEEYTGKFVIHYRYRDRYRNERVVIDSETSVAEGFDYETNCFYTELRALIELNFKEQQGEVEKERQQILDKLSDREKELLVLV